jgi:uncharacterized membrane protein required for colicin V production
MDWIILISITAISAFAGYRKGALMMAVRVIAFVLGYVVAWKLTPPLAQWLIDTHKLQGVIVYPAAGLALFFGTGIVLNIVSSILFLLIPSHIKEGGKLAGAFLGGLFGLVFGLLCVWTVGIVHNAILQRQQAADSATTIISTAQSTSVARQFAGKIISTATQAVMGDTNSTAITSQLLSDPVSISQGLNYLAKQPNVGELFRNADNYRTMVNGTPSDIIQIPAFQQLVNDDEAMSFLSKTGLTGNNEQEKQVTLAKNFSMYAKNIDKIKNTPEYRSIITDPEIATQLKAGNYMALLTNEKVRLLAEMITHGSNSSGTTTSAIIIPNDNKKITSSDNDEKPQKIYRWKDKQGGMHYGETPPEPSDVSGDVIQMTR